MSLLELLLLTRRLGHSGPSGAIILGVLFFLFILLPIISKGILKIYNKTLEKEALDSARFRSQKDNKLANVSAEEQTPKSPGSLTDEQP